MWSQDLINKKVDKLVRGEVDGPSDLGLGHLVSSLFMSRDVYLNYHNKELLVNALFKALQNKDDHLLRLAVEDLVRVCYLQAERLKNIPGSVDDEDLWPMD